MFLDHQGLRCTKCGEILNRVYKTARGEDCVQRRRLCPGCKERVATVERIVTSNAATDTATGPVVEDNQSLS